MSRAEVWFLRVLGCLMLAEMVALVAYAAKFLAEVLL